MGVLAAEDALRKICEDKQYPALRAAAKEGRVRIVMSFADWRDRQISILNTHKQVFRCISLTGFPNFRDVASELNRDLGGDDSLAYLSPFYAAVQQKKQNKQKKRERYNERRLARGQ